MSLQTLDTVVIDERILRSLSEMGFEQFTPIQEQAIPAVLEGRDVIGQAQTGTGKTAAFGVPLLQMVDPEDESLQAIILCPTRELAIQAAEEIRKFAKYMHGIRVLPVYGGQDIMKQIRSLRGGVQIVVGTPGRVMDHMRRHTLKPDNVKMVVLDEADEMLAMGFREDMETIIGEIESDHQTMLFSATMPQAILDITGQFQKDPLYVKTVAKELTVPSIKQYYYEVRRENKKEATSRLLDYYNPKRTLIFCNTKRMVEELAEELKGRGYFAEGLHGDLSQAMRDRVMSSFKSGTSDVLIATDVAARGIDIDDVEAVINYDVPQENEYYVHRIGRTGRAGRDGRSFTLVVGKEIYKIRDIERSCKTTMTARALPTSDDINHNKAGKVLAQAMEILNAQTEGQNDTMQNLAPMIAYVTEQMEKADVTALELAAAMLRVQVGEDREDIPMISYEEARKQRLSGLGRGKKHGDRGDRRDRRFGDRDDRRGRGDWKEHGERRDRWDRKDGGDHKERGDWKERGERKERGDWKERGERKERSDWKDRGDRKEFFGKMEDGFKKKAGSFETSDQLDSFEKYDKSAKSDKAAKPDKASKSEKSVKVDKHKEKQERFTGKQERFAEKSGKGKDSRGADKGRDKKHKDKGSKKHGHEDFADKIKKFGKPKKLDRHGNPIY